LEPRDGLGEAPFQVDDRFPAEPLPGAGDVGAGCLGSSPAGAETSSLLFEPVMRDDPLANSLIVQFVRVPMLDRFMEVVWESLKMRDEIGTKQKSGLFASRRRR